MMKFLVRLFATLALLFTMASMPACKTTSKKKPSASAKRNTANKKSCEQNFGTYSNKACVCLTGYVKVPGNAFSCKVAPKVLCADGVTNRDNNGNCPNSAQIAQAKTSKDCYDRQGFWNGSSCSPLMPANQSACNGQGDTWNSNKCTRVDPFTKQQICTQRYAQWNNATGTCTCQDQSAFDWSLKNCPSSVGGGYQKGNYSKQQLSGANQGQWQNQGCQCPQGSQYNQQTGYCQATGNQYNQNCPGSYNGGYCYGQSGQQMAYSILYGWITQQRYLTNPDKFQPKNAEDGH
jgi:hypothetical protein